MEPAGCRVDVTGFDPLVAGAAGVAGQDGLAGHASTRTQGGHQLQDRHRAGEVASLLDVEPGVAVALVAIGVGVPLAVGEAQAGSVREGPHGLLVVVASPDGRVEHLAALHGLDQLCALPADHQGDGVLAVLMGVVREVAQHPVSFASTA